ncbi:MAG: [LysW]-aminoadipate semialdehyde transaminase [Anaerolineales bacterium]|nr:[LysW]-aminoadipate semialdehyde transaminase [Anaerolineales bacterium]
MTKNMDVIELERQFASGVYPKREVAIVQGEGALVWDAEGREYIDCVAGHGVANLGHCHPAVAKAIAKQAQTLITCPEVFHNDRRGELLSQLTAHLPDGLTRIFLCNSGAEAVEGAIKFARLSTGRPGIVATMRGFHGRTLGALSATWKRKYREPFEPLVPGFSHVPFDNLERMAQAVGEDTAAVLVEIVQGEGGVRPGSPEYFQGLRELCDERGAHLIVDEVQTGFGRTGCWFAVEHAGIVPDLMCLGKAIAGGVPMGAVAIGPAVSELPTGVHGSTFGGNPLACSASIAALEAFEREGLTQRSAEMGAYTQERLRAIQSPLIREVRGLGLMIGVEFKTRVTPVLRDLMERGVLALPAGTTVLRLLPPLVISRDQIDTVVAAIAATLDQ